MQKLCSLYLVSIILERWQRFAHEDDIIDISAPVSIIAGTLRQSNFKVLNKRCNQLTIKNEFTRKPLTSHIICKGSKLPDVTLKIWEQTKVAMINLIVPNFIIAIAVVMWYNILDAAEFFLMRAEISTDISANPTIDKNGQTLEFWWNTNN